MSRSLMFFVATALSVAVPMTSTALGGIVAESNLVGWWEMGAGATWNDFSRNRGCHCRR